jgi:MATE family multidrug resistance protein
MHPAHSFATQIKNTLNLAVPLIIVLMVQKGLQLISTYMMGLLGADELAAAAVSTTAYMVVIVVALGIQNASGVLMAHALAAHKKQEFIQFLHHGFYCNLFLFIPFMVLIWLLPELFLKLKQPLLIVNLSRDYLHAVIWGFPAILGFMLLREFIAVIKLLRIILVVSIIILPINFILSYLLTFGSFGLPRLAISGVGYAGALTEWIMFFSILFYLLKHPALSEFEGFKKFSPLNFQVIKKIFYLGLPLSINFFIDLFLFTLVAILMAYLGIEVLAGHQIAFQSVAFAYMFPLGISFAISILVAQAVGSENFAVLNKIIWVGIGIGTLFTIIISILFIFFSNVIIGIFIHPWEKNYATVEFYARIFLGLGCLFIFFDMLQGIIWGCLRGFKDTFIPMVSAFVFYVLVGLGLGYWLAFRMHMGGVGLWIAVICAFFLQSLFLALRLIFVIKKYKKF